jgi:hypothetical protein
VTDPADPNYERDLGAGLRLRWSTAADAPGIAHLLGMNWRDAAADPSNPRMVERVIRRMRGDYPLMGPGDVALVEDTHAAGRPVVACAHLWREEWEYAGIPFGVGRPEDVATDPPYRNRGLVRAIFELLHARCAAERLVVQAITGIPHFYRQFGYGYALDLHGRRVADLERIPPAPAGAPEPYALRPASLADLPAVMAIYDHRRAGSLVWNRVTERYWRYQIEVWDDPAVAGRSAVEHGVNERVLILIDQAGAPCGLVSACCKRWTQDLQVFMIELAAGVSWQRAMPPLLRALARYGATSEAISPAVAPFRSLSLELGGTHPAYDALGAEIAPFYERPYAWYVRVPDLPGFLRLIAPELERRLEQSSAASYTGELKIDFYRSGVRMAFEQGRLIAAKPWRAQQFQPAADASCPADVFVQLLFGHRDLDELRHAFPDVLASGVGEPLLRALFPKAPSWVLAL